MVRIFKLAVWDPMLSKIIFIIYPFSFFFVWQAFGPGPDSVRVECFGLSAWVSVAYLSRCVRSVLNEFGEQAA